MRKSLLIFAAASLLLAGCQKEQPVEKELSNVVVTEVSATFEDLIPDGATKASVNITGNVGKFSWQGGDDAAFILDSKNKYGKGTYNESTKKFNIVGSGTANEHYDAVYPYDLVGSTSPSTENVNSITVPASRTWAIDQTNVSMYGSYSGSSYTFKHLGGLVKVTVVNVPVEAKTFVFKTTGKKINGTFNIEASGSDKVINTSSSPATGEDTYTLNLNVASANTTMVFYVPLPVGEKYVFSFYLKDSEGKDLAKVEGSTEYDVARKSILVMPTITLTAVDAGIEDTEKAAVVQEVPTGHSGDFLLANSEKVLLKINAGTESENKNINLKYNGGNVPTELEIQVVGENAFNKKLSGNLPQTHVEFTQGEIAEVEMRTSSSTFAIIHPAKISTKLTVTGGNVKVKGATVATIEVAENAKADGDKAPVEIVVEKKGDKVPNVTNGIKANADVVVAPAENVTVKVTTEGDAKVANGGKGTVKDNDDKDITTKAAAQIGNIKYFTLADAIAAVKNDEVIKLIAEVADAKGITVPSGKNFTVDFGGFTYTCASDPAGSDGTKNQVFQLLKNSTITFKNGTINVKEDAKSQFRFIIQNYANLTLEDITLDGTNLAISDGRVNYTVSNNYGNVVFKGGTKIKAAATKGVAFDVCKSNDNINYPEPPTVTVNTTDTIKGQVEVTGGTLNVKAGTFETTGARRTSDANHQSPTLLVTSGNVTVNGGSFTSEHDVAVRAEGGSVTLEGGEFTAPEGAVCFPGVGAIINIKGGTYTASDNAVLIGQGSDKNGNGNTVNISGGTFNGGIKSPGYIACGIYAPWKDKITVTGGTFNITNGAGVVARAGVVTINGGTFNCTGTATGKVGDKAVNLPCECLIFDDSDPNYPGKDENSKIVVNGGTFSDESAIKYAANGADINIELLANRNASGIFLGKNKNVKVTFDLGGKTLNFKAPAVGSSGTENQAFHIEQGNQLFTLKNGKVTIDADAKSAFRFIIQNYNNLTVDGVELDGTNLAYNVNDKVRYTVSNNQGTVNFTGNTIIKAAAENGIAFDVCKNGSYTAPTVTWSSSGSVDGEIELTGGEFILGHNLEVNQPIRVKAAATLNLDTYTLSGSSDFSKKGRGVVIVNRVGDLTINGTTGVIDGATNQVSAAVVLTEPETWDQTTKLNELAKLTVNGGTLKGYYYGIVGNGLRNNTEITINGGTITGTCNTEKYGNSGIYHPQEGKLTIKGGIITGLDNAVEVRSGTEVIISGGTFTSTASKYSCVKNGSGSTTVGAALAIAQHTTKHPINVTISGGTFTGPRAVALEDIESNKDGDNVNVSISGGTYTATEYAVFNNYAGTTINISDGEFESTGANGIAVYARLGSVNITGGEFTNTSNSEATLHVGCPAAKEASLQPKLTISGTGAVVKNNATGDYPYKSGWKALTVNMANELTYKAVEISGGTFHGQKPDVDDDWKSESDTHKYFLANNHEAKETSTGSNVWTVSAKNN